MTLRIVAQYATIWNGQGEPDELARKNRILDEWCARVGRDPKEIERSAQIFGPQLDQLDDYLAAASPTSSASHPARTTISRRFTDASPGATAMPAQLREIT